MSDAIFTSLYCKINVHVYTFIYVYVYVYLYSPPQTELVEFSKWGNSLTCFAKSS